MGSYLDKPLKEKGTEAGEFWLEQDGESGNVQKLPFVLSSMQGWRKTMEDAHIAATNLEDKYDDLPKGTAVFAVFDGHAGNEVAEFCGAHYVETLIELESFKAGAYREALTESFHKIDELLQDPKHAKELNYLRNKGFTSDDESIRSYGPDQEIETDTEQSPEHTKAVEDLAENLEKLGVDNEDEDAPNGVPLPRGVQDTVKSAEEEGVMSKNDALSVIVELFASDSNDIRMLLANPEQESNGADLLESTSKTKYTSAGATALVALFIKGRLFVANAGDSRAVLSSAGLPVAMSFDHKPLNQLEKERIEEAGGYVTKFGRICGNLNLSRTLGDLKYKENDEMPRERQMITAEPDIESRQILKEDYFLFMACDGIYDVKTNPDVVAFVQDKLTSLTEAEITEIEQTNDLAYLKIWVEDLLEDCISENPVGNRGLGGDNMTCIIIFLKPVRELVNLLTK